MPRAAMHLLRALLHAAIAAKRNMCLLKLKQRKSVVG